MTVNQTAEATLYRRHRGGLAESMETVCEIWNMPHLVETIRSDREGWPDQAEVTLVALEVKPYGFDARIGWDTHIVLVAGRPTGFTNGMPANE